jgi:putative membrane protein
MHGEWGMIGPFMMLIPLAILILIVWLIVKLVSSKKNVGETDQAMSILRERFARGEIDQQEFESRKQHLDHSDP